MILTLRTLRRLTRHLHNDIYSPIGHNHDADYSPIGHNHDGRYYTETEVDNLLSGKSDVVHSHPGGAKLVGEIFIYAGLDTPQDTLPCSGQAVSRTEYSDLFSVIGETYGAGDGSTTFNLPLLAARFPMGSTISNPPGAQGGEAEHTLTDDEMPAHSHSYERSAAGTSDQYASRDTGQAGLRYETHVSDSTGGGQPHNNIPPYLAVRFLIQAK